MTQPLNHAQPPTESHHTLILEKTPLTLEALPSAVDLVARSARELLDAHISEHDAAWIMTTALVIEALRRTKGNKCQAARLLKIHRNTLCRQTEAFALNPYVGDIKKIVDSQLNLFSRKRRSIAERIVGASA